MQTIPMENLTRMMSRTDSGAGVKHKSQAVSSTGASWFGQILDERRTVMDYQVWREGTNPNETDARDDAVMISPEIPKNEVRAETDTEEDSEAYMALYAGVVGNQDLVVIILEGDKESTTTPEVRVDDTVHIPDYTVETPPVTSEAPNVQPEVEVKTDTAAMLTETESIYIADPETTDFAAALQNAETKDVIGDKSEEPLVATETQDTAGEVMARTPTIRTSQKQENEDNSSEFSKNGDLSPLENENDTVPAQGQKEKSLSAIETAVRDTVDSDVRSANESTVETVDSAPVAPLTDGIQPERFQATQQMRQATLEAPVRTENLFDEMISRIETMQSEDQRTMTIQLKPEFLGNVALEIAMDAAGFHVKISATDSDVRTMINGQINALIESLENKGIEVVEVEVAYTGVNNGAFKDSREGQAQSENKRRSYRIDKVEDGATYYASLQFDTLENYLDPGVSSVEYSA